MLRAPLSLPSQRPDRGVAARNLVHACADYGVREVIVKSKLRRESVDDLLGAGARLVIFDFDMCILSIHSFFLRLDPRDVAGRSLQSDFVDLPFFQELVGCLVARGIKVAIASFGRYDVIQAFMDRCFEGCGEHLSTVFTRETICTPSSVGLVDGFEVAAGKNPQLDKICAHFGVNPSNVLFLDGSC
jgi:hypothetical protein